MRCDDARWQLILYCDGDLDAESARALEQHLETCESCRAELERLQATERAVGEALGEVEDDGGEVVGRIRTGVARERRLREGTRPATRLRTTVLVGVATALVALTALTVPTVVAPLSAPPRQVEVEWPETAADGATVAVRVWCRDAVSRKPLSGEGITLAVHNSTDYRRGPVSSASGVTDAEGLFHGRVRMPASSRPIDVRLGVEAGTGLTSTEMHHTLRVMPRRRAFVWLDRSPARAGSKLAVAGLILRAADGTPARDEPVRLAVISADGTVYMTRDDRTDASGFVRASTQLPAEAPAGTYRAVLEHDRITREYAFTVRAEPRGDIDVALAVDPPVASPGQMVTVTTSGTHPSGAPAARARIRIHAGPEWQEGQPRVVGAADPDGRLEAQLAVPSPDSASPATGFRVSAEYRSDDLERGWGAASVGLSGETLRMLVAAQGGALVPGRYGIIEVLVFDDRGLPVPARVTGELAGSRVALETGPDGVAELWAGSVPADGSVLVELKATDGAGRTGSVRQTIPAAPPGSIVPVADRGIAHPGETLAVDLYSDRDGLALLDLVREGHTVYATSVRLMGGEARVYIPIDSRMTGTLGMRARWPDQPAPAALPALFVDPTRQVDLSAPSGALDPGSNRAETEVQLAGSPWRGRIFGAITPVERPGAPADTDPALAWLALGTRALDMVAQDELNRLSLSWVRGDRPSLSRRPSRLFLSAAGVPSAEPRRATAGPGTQQAQIRERQQRLFRGLAFTLAVLAALAFLGVLVGGELRVRSAAGLGESEAASGYLRRLRTDLLLCGAALLVAAAAAGHFHVRLASSGIPSATVIRPQAGNDLPTTGPTNDGLAPPCTVLQAHLPTGVVLPRSIDTGSPGGEMFLHMPDRPADFRCSALAVGSDGTLGFDEGFLTVRPLYIETLLVDGHGRKGEDVAVAVELTNRSPNEETAELRVSGVGARVTDGAESRVVVPPRTTLRAYATVVPETEGTVWVRAWAEWSDGESWQDSVPVAVTPQRSTVLVGAGAAGRGGARLPADGGTEAVGGHRVALVRGREALASQFVEALAPPWLTIDEPAWSLMISVRVLDVYGGPSESHRRWRVLARERIREAVLAILARRSGPAYGVSPGAEADLRSSALALLALAEARPWSPQATAALPGSRDGLLQLCFQAPEQMTDSERALAAWALARAGAARESVLPLLASAVREAEGQDEGATGPERLALAALAFHELGMDPEARGVAERLARVAQPLSGEEAVPGGVSVMGSGERRAEAEVTALCALALERVDPPSPSRPTRQWLLRRLAELRGGDLLFGGASTNGLCGMALLDLMRDPQGDTTRVSVEQEGAQVIIDVPLDRWLDITVERPAEEGAQTMRAIDSEPVHYVILAEASEPSLARAVTSVTPLGDGRTGQLSVTATNAEPSVMHRAELRVPLPTGLEPYLPDLTDAAARGVIGAYVVEGGVVRCLLDDLAPSDSVTLAFRVRAVRVPRVQEVQLGAELVPAGSGG